MRSQYTDFPPPSLAPVLSLSQFPGPPPSPYAYPSPNLPPTTPFPPPPTSNRTSIHPSSTRQSSFNIRVPSTSFHQPEISQNPFGAHQHPFPSQLASPQFPSTYDRAWQLQPPFSSTLAHGTNAAQSNYEDMKAKQILEVCDISKSVEDSHHNPKGQEFEIYRLLLDLQLCVSLASDDQWGSSNDLKYFLHLSHSANSCQTTEKPRRPGRKGSIMCARCRTQRQGSRVCSASAHCIDYRTLASAFLIVLLGLVYLVSKPFKPRNVA